jgi:hypothetical protein
LPVLRQQGIAHRARGVVAPACAAANVGCRPVQGKGEPGQSTAGRQHRDEDREDDMEARGDLAHGWARAF